MIDTILTIIGFVACWLFGAWILSIVYPGPKPRYRPPPRGICRRCGYDLRATPKRCPECGEWV